MLGFMVCLASSNSDTWASEIGSLSRKKPIYIRTFKRIERGTSGAISGLGTVAAFAGLFYLHIKLFAFRYRNLCSYDCFPIWLYR